MAHGQSNGSVFRFGREPAVGRNGFVMKQLRSEAFIVSNHDCGSYLRVLRLGRCRKLLRPSGAVLALILAGARTTAFRTGGAATRPRTQSLLNRTMKPTGPARYNLCRQYVYDADAD
jgi:hypothetical protein